MKNTVILKGNRYGISIVLDDTVPFSQLLEDIKDKLANAEDFFDSKRQLAVAFEGRTLTNDELDAILEVIDTHSKLNIQYVMDENSDLEATFYDIIQTAKNEDSTEDFEEQLIDVTQVTKDLSETEDRENTSDHIQESGYPVKEEGTDSENTGMFYKGTLRSGQCLEAKNSIVIIGDVHPGASVIADGNIIVIGALKGNAFAGAAGNTKAFVLAMDMRPIQIQIADRIARSADDKVGNNTKEAMLAKIEENQICMEPVSKTAISDILN